MHGRLKGFNNPSEKLFCGDDGTWKTGYEDIGLDVAGVCFPRGNTLLFNFGVLPEEVTCKIQNCLRHIKATLTRV